MQAALAATANLSSHAWLHARSHAGVSSHAVHLHAHALPRLIHELQEQIQ